jgi:tetratricopeptide (TPR) repeat protein
MPAAAPLPGAIGDLLLVQFSKLFAQLYPRQEDSHRIAASAGLDRGLITFSSAANTNWFNILESARSEGKVLAVVTAALEDHPETAELQRAAEALRNPSVSRSSPPSPATSSPSTARVSIARLPATSRELFGREAELRWLDACWRDGAHVASVVAWGGVGKSALVNAWLATLREEGWRGAERIYGWSFYSQGTDRLSSSDEFIDAALRWFGDSDPKQGSPWDKGERLAALVRKQRTILVLDGLEPLQWGPGVEHGKLKDQAVCALVKELGAQNQGLCLITTRIALTDLEALAGPHGVATHDLDHLSAEAGAELLAAHGAEGPPAELRDAAREYDGHSLALTLLGSYVRKAHKGDIRKRALIPPLAGKPAHRIMATYERWFAGTPELAILRMLGLFDRPATGEEIAALRAEPAVVGLTDTLAGVGEGGWNEAVTTLRDVGLLAREEEPDDRLDAHPLVREHFGEQLRREQPEAWREGHWRLYEHLRKTAKELPETIEEMAPLYAAVVHGCQAGKNQEALREVWWKSIRHGREQFSIHKLGAFGSEVAVLSAFFDPPWARLAPGLTESDQAAVLNNAGFALRALGRLPEATGLLRLGLERYIAQQSWTHAAICASNLTDLLQARGELREALAQARRSVELADKSGDVFERVSRRTTLGAALHATGLREGAAAQFEEAERMQKDDMHSAYPALYSLRGFRYCDLLLDRGPDAEVRERAARMLASVPSWYSLLDIALDHLSLGRAHLLAAQRTPAGDLAAAASHLQQAVDGLRRAARQDHLPLGLLARADLHTYTGAFPAARRDLDEALSLATRCGLRLHLADAHLGHARLSLAEGARVAAAAHLAEARSIIDATGYHRRDAELAALEAALPSPPPPAPV